MKLVTDGEYWAIRRWSWLWLSWEFLDFDNPKYWWPKDLEFFHTACWTKDKKKAEVTLRRLKS